MEHTEQELIQAAKRGEHNALESIFRQHLDGAVRLAYLITKNWATAEDAVQEAFYRHFAHFTISRMISRLSLGSLE